jgi:hypothetical protein
MDSRLRFRPRFLDVELPGDPGTKLPRLCGLTVKGRRPRGRDLMTSVRGNPSARAVESAGEKSPGGSLRSVRTVNRHR